MCQDKVALLDPAAQKPVGQPVDRLIKLIEAKDFFLIFLIDKDDKWFGAMLTDLTLQKFAKIHVATDNRGIFCV